MKNIFRIAGLAVGLLAIGQAGPMRAMQNTPEDFMAKNAAQLEVGQIFEDDGKEYRITASAKNTSRTRSPRYPMTGEEITVYTLTAERPVRCCCIKLRHIIQVCQTLRLNSATQSINGIVAHEEPYYASVKGIQWLGSWYELPKSKQD